MSAGSVFKRKSDGLWCATLQVDGRRKYAYAHSEKEARKKLARLQKELTLTGALTLPGKKTVNDLLDLWLDTVELRPQSRAGYTRLLDKHVRPTLGKVRLSRLQPEHLQRLYNSLKDKPSIAWLAHQRLSRAFRLAVLWGWLSFNPCDRVVRPAYKPERKQVWTAEELATFLESSREHWLGPLWVVAVTTGLRIAELSGLQWGDVHWEQGTLEVRRALNLVYKKGGQEWIEGAPKTASGERTLKLPAEGVAALRRQRKQQLEWKLAAGREWQAGSWIFTNKLGEPLSRSTAFMGLRRACRDAGVPRVSPHQLRHLHASLLLDGGLPVPAVAAQLGHANAAVTMSVYAHVIKKEGSEAAAIMERVLGAGKEGREETG